MTLAGFDGVVVFVEGPTDMIVFEDFLPKDRFRVIHAVSKDIALEALSLIDSYDNVPEEKKRRVVALVDADFDRCLGIGCRTRSFVTDQHDLEVMMVWSEAFSRWLREYGSAEKVANFGGVDAVREKLVELAKFLGAMRLYARRTGIPLDFSKLRYETYLDKRTLAVNRLGACQGMHGANRALFDGVSVADFLAAVEAELDSYVGSALDLIQGHDLLNLLGVMMRFALASLDSGMASEEQIAPALRLAYRPGEWLATAMAAALQRYLEDNHLPSVISA